MNSSSLKPQTLRVVWQVESLMSAPYIPGLKAQGFTAIPDKIISGAQR